VLHNLCHTLEILPSSGTCVFGDPSQILSEQDGVMEIILFVVWRPFANFKWAGWCDGDNSVRIWVGTLAVLTSMFRDFPHCIQANSGIVPHRFQFLPPCSELLAS